MDSHGFLFDVRLEQWRSTLQEFQHTWIFQLSDLGSNRDLGLLLLGFELRGKQSLAGAESLLWLKAMSNGKQSWRLPHTWLAMLDVCVGGVNVMRWIGDAQ